MIKKKKKDKARDVEKKKKNRTERSRTDRSGAGGQLEDVAVIRAGRLVVPSQDD